MEAPSGTVERRQDAAAAAAAAAELSNDASSSLIDECQCQQQEEREEGPSSPSPSLNQAARPTKKPQQHRKKKRCNVNDDCLRVYAVIPRIFTVLAFAFSMACLLDCRLLKLNKTFLATSPNTTTTSIATTTITTNVTTISKDNNESSSSLTSIAVNGSFYFGLYQYAPTYIIFPNGSSYLFRDMLQSSSWPATTMSTTLLNATATSLNWTVASSTTKCWQYPASLPISPQHNAARAFAILAVIVGGWMVLILWFKCCCGLVCSYLCPDVLVSVVFLVVLPVIQGLAMVANREFCNFKIEPLLGLTAAAEAAGWSVQENRTYCGVDRMGFVYPLSIVLWIISGLLFTWIRPRTQDDLLYFQG